MMLPPPLLSGLFPGDAILEVNDAPSSSGEGGGGHYKSSLSPSLVPQRTVGMFNKLHDIIRQCKQANYV